MAAYRIQGETLTAIADAIRSKVGATMTLTPAQMAGAIEAVQLQEKTVTPTGSVQEVTPDYGYYGLGKVTVKAAEGTVLPDNARLYYVGTANGVWNITGTIFNSTASGAIS